MLRIFYLGEYFTDGCAEQYKNYKSFSNIAYHEKDFGIEGIWSFFATSHGKSSCDGVGGTIKRCTANESLRRSPSNGIITVEEMVRYCIATFPTIRIESISCEEIQASTSKTDKRISLSSTLNGTHGFHYYEHVGNGKIGVKIMSSDDKFELKVDHVPVIYHKIKSFAVGHYLVFVYDHKWYIGWVNAVEKASDEMEVCSMHPHGPSSSFFWPDRADTVWVTLAQVLCKIDCPNMYSSRGLYNLQKKASKRFQNYGTYSAITHKY